MRPRSWPVAPPPARLALQTRGRSSRPHQPRSRRTASEGTEFWPRRHEGTKKFSIFVFSCLRGYSSQLLSAQPRRPRKSRSKTVAAPTCAPVVTNATVARVKDRRPLVRAWGPHRPRLWRSRRGSAGRRVRCLHTRTRCSPTPSSPISTHSCGRGPGLRRRPVCRDLTDVMRGTHTPHPDHSLV